MQARSRPFGRLPAPVIRPVRASRNGPEVGPRSDWRRQCWTAIVFGIVTQRGRGLSHSKPQPEDAAVKKSRRASRPGVVARVAALAFVLIALGITRAPAQPATAALSADDAKAIGTDAF